MKKLISSLETKHIRGYNMWFKFAMKNIIAQGFGGGFINKVAPVKPAVPKIPAYDNKKPDPDALTNNMGPAVNPNKYTPYQIVDGPAVQITHERRIDPKKKNPEELSQSEQIDALHHDNNNFPQNGQSMSSLEDTKPGEVVRGTEQEHAYNSVYNFTS